MGHLYHIRVPYTQGMFRRLGISDYVLCAATYYIPLYPRYIKQFKYTELRDAVVLECIRTRGTREDHEKIANEIANLHKYDGKEIYTNIKFPRANSPRLHGHIVTGTIARIAIVAAALIATERWHIGAYATLSAASAIFTIYSPDAREIAERMERVNQILHQGARLNIEKNIFFNQIKINDYLNELDYNQPDSPQENIQAETQKRPI